MTSSQVFSLAVMLLILARWLAQLILERLNEIEVRRHGCQIPKAFQGFIDPPTYARSVAYTLAKNRWAKVEVTWDALVLLAILFSGWLPWAYHITLRILGNGQWAQAVFLVSMGILLSILNLPIDWHSQFRVEERFGFNTTTQKLWWLDRGKGLVLGIILGYPLIVLMLKTVGWAGSLWWLWAWVGLLVFQGIMMVLAPVVILPLFNRFTPLPHGSLRERLLALAQKTRFPARHIEVMDGSKRSRHSNAFFTGFGRFRKIVLFDTLIQQLSEAELEAVLAHEIGHYQHHHLLKMLATSALSLLAGLYFLAWLAHRDWLYGAFGFVPGPLAPALLLFGLLAGTVTFWMSPLPHYWSRCFEFQADAFAAQAMETATPLINALRKLTEKNLGNLTPHPLYSHFYYSHPTPWERERALTAGETIGHAPGSDINVGPE